MKSESNLKFNGYVVDEIVFIRNNNSNEFNGEIDISFSKNIEKSENKAKVSLSANVFKNPLENNYPFEFKVVITGLFDFQDVENELVDNVLNNNCLAILFPYLRAIISTYTALANVNSLILPAVNISSMFDNK